MAKPDTGRQELARRMMNSFTNGSTTLRLTQGTACAISMVLSLLSACSTTPVTDTPVDNARGEDLLTVDCLLPPQVRQLGTQFSYLGPRRAIRTSGARCAMRGGEYVAYARADFTSALAVWLPLAQGGDPQAQTYVGEIYEKGMGTPASYELAAAWYQRAVQQNYSRAQINLGYLYESGLGVERNIAKALNLYRQAAGFTNADLEFVSSVEIAKRKAAALQNERQQSQLQILRDNVMLKQRQLDAKSQDLEISRKQIDELQSTISSNANDRGQSAIDISSLPKQGMTTLPVQGLALAQTRANTFGTYHALIIGNGRYDNLDALNTSHNDATAIERVLREHYGFSTTLLLDANHDTLLGELERMRKTLDENDNLIIYYAGHGELDERSGRGYWLPTDAHDKSKDKWIANSAISAMIDRMQAKHVLVIADSCYSGTLTRSSVARRLPEADSALKLKWLEAVSQVKVRAVLSSGSNQPVSVDSGNAVHSVFAQQLIKVLEQNIEILEAYELFMRIQPDDSSTVNEQATLPNANYAPIKHAGHQAGEFIFLPATGMSGASGNQRRP